MRARIALLCVCLLLTGCGQLPQAREMGDMALLRVMGVDRGEDGVAVTVSTGLRARGIEGEQEGALTLTARGTSLTGAVLAVQGQSDSCVFFGHVDQLLLGEELAEESVLPVLEYVSRDEALSLGAQLWIVRGDTARSAVESGGEQGTDHRLSTLRTDGKLGIAALPRTAGEVYADLLERGCAYVPALAPEEGESTSLRERGYAVLKGEKLAGFLDGEAARGLELLAGRPSLDAVEFELGDSRAVLELTGARVSPRLIREAWRPEELAVSCRVEARLAEYGGALSETDRELLERELAARMQTRIRAALERLQEWQADCAALGGGTNWNERFGRMEVRVEVTAAVRR